jgi:hypothetical protein
MAKKILKKPDYSDPFKGRITETFEGGINVNPDVLENKAHMQGNLLRSGVGFEEMDVWRRDAASMYEFQNPGKMWQSERVKFDPEFHEFEQTLWQDTYGAFGNAFIDLGEGLLSVGGTIGAGISYGLGSESGEEFFDNYIEAVDLATDNIRFNQSDKALGRAGGDWNAHRIMSGVGQGVGFISTLFLGGAIGNIVGGAGKLGGISGALMGTSRGARIGRFMSGHLSMMPAIYEEARRGGLSPGEAALMSNSIASVVQLSEGAALEALGATLSRPVTLGAAKEATRDAIKGMAKAGKLDASLFARKELVAGASKGFARRLKGSGRAALSGAGIEFTQEFSQQYIETGMKQFWDEMFGAEGRLRKAVGGKEGGSFGVDVASSKSFQQALFGGFVGALVGGGMGFGGRMARGVETETLYSHIQDRVKNSSYAQRVGKDENGKTKWQSSLTEDIANLKKHAEALHAKGQLGNKLEVVNARIDGMVNHALRTKGLNIENPTADFQLYQLMETEKELTEKFKQKYGIDKETHQLVADAYKEHGETAEYILRSLQLEMSTIMETKEPIKKGEIPNRKEFDGRLDKYKRLMRDVINGKKNKQEVFESLTEMMHPAVQEKFAKEFAEELKKAQEAEEAAKQAKAKQEGTKVDEALPYVDLGGGRKFTQKAYDNYESLVQEYTQALRQSNEGDVSALERFNQKLRSEYGMTMKDWEALDEGGANFETPAKLVEAIQKGEVEFTQPEVKEEITEEEKADLQQEKEDEEKYGELAKQAEQFTRDLEADKELQDMAKDMTEEEVFAEIDKRKSKLSPELQKFMEEDWKGYEERKAERAKRAEERAKRKTERQEAEKKPTKPTEGKEDVDEEVDVEEDTDEVSDEDFRDAQLEQKAEAVEAGVIKMEDMTPDERAELEDYLKRRPEFLERQKSNIERKAKAKAFKSIQDKYANTLNIKRDAGDKFTIDVQSGKNVADPAVQAAIYEANSELFDAGFRPRVRVAETQETAKPGEQAKIDFGEEQAEEVAEEIEGREEEEFTAPVNSDNIFDAIDSVEDDTASDITKESQDKNTQDKNRKDQRKRLEPNSAVQTIAQNPELYARIKSHFRRMFPGLSVREVENAMWEYGPEVLARVSEAGIDINVDTGLQTSLIHEYAHVFYDLFATDIDKRMARNLMRNTSYHKDAQKMYPEKSTNEQLDEAVMEAVAEKTLDKLKVRLEGTMLEKFLAWMKKFWRSIKRRIAPQYSDIIEIQSDMMAYNNGSYTIDKGVLTTADQRSKQYVMTGQFLNNALTGAKARYMLGQTKIDVSKENNMQYMAFSSLLERYMAETSTTEETQVHPSERFLDTINGSLRGELDAMVNEEGQPLNKPRLVRFIQELKDNHQDLFELTLRTASSMSRRPIPVLDDVENEIKVTLKGDQKVSETVRGLITTLTDEDGGLIPPSSVYSYVAQLGNKSLSPNEFYLGLKQDANQGKIIARRLLGVIDSAVSRDISRGILTEMSSIVQLEYRSVVMQLDKDGNIEVVNKIKNRSRQYDGYRAELSHHLYTLTPQQRNDIIDDINTWAAFENFSQQLLNDASTRNRFRMSLGQVLGQQLNDAHVVEILEQFPAKEGKRLNGLQAWLTFNVKKALNENQNVNEIRTEIHGSTLARIHEAINDTALDHMFVNSSGNNVSSSRLGYWMTQFNKLLQYSPEYANELKASPVYKNNPVLKYMMDKGKVGWFIHDAISNDLHGRAIEYNRESFSDGNMVDLIYFAGLNAATDSYHQRIGITGDRGHKTYFEVKRYTKSQMESLYQQRAEDLMKHFDQRIQRLYGKRLNQVTLEEIKNDVDLFNKLNLIKLTYENGEWNVVTPFDENSDAAIAKQEAIDTLKRNLEDSKLTDAISKRFILSETPMYTGLDQMLETFVLNESLNRGYLTDIYAGPGLDRKNVADVVKRLSGSNSGGTFINVEKPVRMIVFKSDGMRTGKTNSDSFNVNGSHFTDNMRYQIGPLNPVGVNSKDGLYQVDPTSGHNFFLKRSSLNLSGTEGDHSLVNFSNPDADTDINYTEIGNAVLRFEKAYGEIIGDEQPFVNLVDDKTLKGVVKNNKGQYVMGDIVIEPITLEEFIEATKSPEGIQSLVDGNGSFDQKFYNYRQAFNMNKDLSKVSLEQQNVTLSTQLTNIALNHGEQPVTQFQNLLVQVLANQMEMSEALESDTAYDNSKIVKQLAREKSLLEQLIANADDQSQNSVHLLLNTIYEFNRAEVEKVKADKNYTPKIITAFDHPMTTLAIENHVGSRLTKTGVRVKMPGAYLHMVPNLGSDLKSFQVDSDGKMTQAAEIAVPWSMFVQKQEGETDADAKARAEELLRTNPELFRMVTVRVPASTGVSIMAAQVKYFTDGHSNTMITPDEYIVASDADHDGDKMFAYRIEFDEDGNPMMDSDKTKMFEMLYQQTASNSMVREAMTQTLELDAVRKQVSTALGTTSIEDFQLSDLTDMNKMASKMSFGTDAIGIWAVASKMLSTLSQSKEQLKDPLIFNDKKYQSFDASGQNQDAAHQVALMLQAALDLNNDPVLLTTGVNKHTIGVATTLTTLGVPPIEIVAFLRSPGIESLVNKLESKEGSFSDDTLVYLSDFVNAYRGDLMDEVGNIITDVSGRGIDVAIEKGFPVNSAEIKDGINITKSGRMFFATKVADVPGGRAQFDVRELNDLDLQNNPEQFEALRDIDKFVEINQIANDIKRIIPILQLDNKLPNTKGDLFALRKAFEVLESGQDGNQVLRITTQEIMKRPLTQHYRQVVNQQAKIYRKHLMTFDESFKTLANQIVEEQNPRATEDKKVKMYNAITQSFMRYAAQKSAMEIMGSKKLMFKNPQQAMNELAMRLLSIQKVQNNAFTLSNPAIDNVYTQRVVNGDMTIEAWEEMMREDYPAEVMDQIMMEIASYQDAMDVAEELRDNKALKLLQPFEKEGNYVINGKHEVRYMNESTRKELQDDFEKLKVVDPALYYGLISQQVMRFGLDNKINSYSDMLPDSIHLAYFEHISKLKRFMSGFVNKNVSRNRTEVQEGVEKQKPQIPLVEINAMLDMSETLTKVEDIQDRVLDMKQNEIRFKADPKSKKVSGVPNFITREGEMYVRKTPNSDTWVASSKRNMFKNDNFTQYLPTMDQDKVVSIEKLEEMRACKK